MAMKHATIKAPLQKLFAVADWNADHTGTAAPDIHGIADATKHSADETPGQILKADANGLPIDATNTDAEVSGAVAASHAKQHAITSGADHTSAVAINKHFKADANGLPIEGANTDAEISGAVTASHAKQHSITATADHTSTATSGRMLKADANGLPINATNTDAAVAAAVTASHARSHAMNSASDHSAGTQGDILYAAAGGAWARLAAAASGQFLKTQGGGANPVWATVSVPGAIKQSVIEGGDGEQATQNPAYQNTDAIITLNTVAGDKVLLIGTCTVGNSWTAYITYVALAFDDVVQQSSRQRCNTGEAAANYNVGLCALIAPSAGSHSYKLKFAAVGSGDWAVIFQRRLIAIVF